MLMIMHGAPANAVYTDSSNFDNTKYDMVGLAANLEPTTPAAQLPCSTSLDLAAERWIVGLLGLNYYIVGDSIWRSEYLTVITNDQFLFPIKIGPF